MSKNKMNSEEIAELRKSLQTLEISEDKIEEYISKAMSDDTDDEAENETIAEQAKKKPGKKADTDDDESEDGKKEAMKKEYAIAKAKIDELEKAMPELSAGNGKGLKGDEPDALKKSIESDFVEKFEDIRKSIADQFAEKFEEQEEIIKSLREDLKKIGDTPLGRKSMSFKANFFEKGMTDEINNEDAKTLSISQDKDELLKSMTDVLNGETDNEIKSMLQDGISDYSINGRPNNHGARALAFVSRKLNIALVQ